MTTLPEEQFLLLNALWLRKMATRGTMEENASLSNAVAESCLRSATELELVREMGDYYVLNDSGRRAILDHYDSEYAGLRSKPEFLEWYERFEGYNGRFLSLMSAWQTESNEVQERTYSRLARVVDRHIEALGVATGWIPATASTRRVSSAVWSTSIPADPTTSAARWWIPCTTSGSSSTRTFWPCWAGLESLWRIKASSRGGRVDSSRFVFSLDEADPSDHALFGGKGAGLAQLVKGGYPVPPGFIISTAACREFMQAGSLPAALGGEIERYIDALEEATSSSFRSVGEPADGVGPLLVSVRSGAPVSMPGMMDTVLNLGINPQRARALAEASGSDQFAAEVMIRFHRMYAEIVLDADGDEVAERGSEFLDGVAADRSETVPFDGLWSAMADAEIEDVGVAVPEDPMAQVRGAIAAVFRSWNTRRATTYRRVNGISDSLGTAVVVQAMVFGNLGSPSGSGVAFTRNPTTGEPGLYGEYLEGGQGEEVVAGTRTPEPLAEAARRLPELFEDFERMALRLEQQRKDVLDLGVHRRAGEAVPAAGAQCQADAECLGAHRRRPPRRGCGEPTGGPERRHARPDPRCRAPPVRAGGARRCEGGREAAGEGDRRLGGPCARRWRYWIPTAPRRSPPKARM